jgi:hypothetical protein
MRSGSRIRDQHRLPMTKSRKHPNLQPIPKCRPQQTHRRLHVPGALFALALSFNLATNAGAAEPLATFECRERLGVDWPRTLVTYPVEFAR